MARIIDKTKSDKSSLAISEKGIMLMIAGVIVIISGFILLSGGGSKDPNVFNYAMFDARRLVAAPIVIVAGIIVETVAIMKRI